MTLVRGNICVVLELPSTGDMIVVAWSRLVLPSGALPERTRASSTASVGSPFMKRRKSSRNCSALLYRMSAFLVRHFAMIASNANGTSGTRSRKRGAASFTCLYAVASAESPANGGFPETNSYSTTPSEYRSERRSNASPFACSGEKYVAVPMTAPSCVSPPS